MNMASINQPGRLHDWGTQHTRVVLVLGHVCYICKKTLTQQERIMFEPWLYSCKIPATDSVHC